MDRKEVKEYIDFETAKGRKVHEVRAFLLSNGVDQLMLDEIIDEILFNAPTQTEIAVNNMKDKEDDRDEVDEMLTNLDPEKDLKPQDQDKELEKVKKKKQKKEKLKPIKIINPRKERAKKLLINSILLIIVSLIIVSLGAFGIDYYFQFKETQQQQMLDQATGGTGNLGLPPLKDVVLRWENMTIMAELDDAAVLGSG